MKNRFKEAPSFIGLDSFMDIVTNVIGALFFVVVYAALSSLGAKGKITTPLRSEAQTEPIFFECRQNTAIYPDLESLQKRLKDEFERRRSQVTPGTLEEFRKTEIKNSYYRWDVAALSRGVISFEKTDGPPGENGYALLQQRSNFRQQLAKFDPSKHHIFIFARADSFEVFHTARRVAISMGFKVGWMPVSADEPLRFGPGGEVPGIG